MPLPFRNVRRDRIDIGLDSRDIEEFLCEGSGFKHRQTFLSTHGYVSTTFDGLAPVICRVDATAIAGFSIDCNQTLQCRKGKEINICK